MDPLELSKTKGMTEEEFRSCYPDVSIQHLSDKSSQRVTPSMEKHQSVKGPPTKAVKSPQVAKTPVQVKPSNIKTTQSIGVRANLPMSKVNTPPPALTKSPVLAKTPVATKTPIVTKIPATPKTTVPTGQVPLLKTPQAAVKATPTKKVPFLKGTNPPKTTPHHGIKQQCSNVVKTPLKATPTTTTTTPLTAAKEDCPDQSTMPVQTYHMPQSTSQRSNQLTIEKIEQQQRIPVVIDSNNQVVLQQVINNGHQLVLQNRVAPAEPTVQSVVIGTTAQAIAPMMAPLSQVEITTSEPLQALQVTQQVTLFRPKGNTFTVDEVKKQINVNKQNTMTNVVSSTTNSITAPVPMPTPTVQQDQNKVFPPRVQRGLQQSPARQSVRVSPNRVQQKTTTPRQYQTTRGQVKKVTPKREIPMQKVLPMQPPPLPPPELQFENEEEVTTSEEVPLPHAISHTGDTKLILILPTGEKKAIFINKDVPLNSTLQDLLKSVNVIMPVDTNHISAEITNASDQEQYQDIETEQVPWDMAAVHVGPEPGEILGLHDIEAGELHRQSVMRLQSEGDESHKDVDTVNNEPLYREGLLAVCKLCGYTSVNFSRCQRCNRPLPPDCKTVSSDFPQKSRKTKADSLTEDSPKKKKVCRKKRHEEPVCLTISDDEELLGLAHHAQLPPEESFHSDSNSQLSSCDKEPVITDEMVSEMKHSVSGGGLDMEDLLDNPDEDKQTFLQCRTVRIGSYKVVPKDKVLITPHGLKVTVPVLNSDQYVELKIMYHEIIKVLIHFGRQMPVLFFYTRPSAAAKIRNALRMKDKNGFYYDSTSSNETHRRITFLPDKIDDDCKQTLKTIFGDPENNVFAELTGKEANDILVKASPKEVQAFIKKKQPNNNQQQQLQQPTLQPFNGQNITTIMIYPPPPEKGGIPINTEDYACLGEDQFLNDVIIDFYLKYLVEKTLEPEDRARTHVFSSFFYKRLTTKPSAKRKSLTPIENDPTATAATKRHSRVKSWTKNVNLFTKDFIVIPINENSHWFLAIICFPGLTGPVRFSDNTPIELPGRKKKIAGKHTVTIGSTTITAVAPAQIVANTVDVVEEGEDRDEADGEDEDMDVSDSDEDPHKPTLPEVKEEPVEDLPAQKKEREPIKQPCILIFDSLAGASRSRVVATLRDYLRVEYETKNGHSRDFSGDVMKGTNLRCPQQTNYTDCGLYVLQYVEAFFQWPITDYHIPIKQLQDWFRADIVSRKRYDIQQLLHRLMQEQDIDVDDLNLPMLNLKCGEKHLVDYSGTDEEEDEDDDDDDEEEEEEEDEEEHMFEDDEDDMMDDDGEFNEEMVIENEGMEEGEIPNPDSYIHPNLENEDHEMDEEEYDMENEDDELPEETEEKELEDVSLTPICPVKSKDLKCYRIPRLSINRKGNNENT